MKNYITKKTKSVEKAIKILEAFSEDNFEMSLPEISKKVNLPKATAYRIIGTLKDNGLINQRVDNGKYRPGLKLFELGSLVFKKLKLREVALPYMEKLSRECGETVHLGILQGDEVISIESCESSFGLRSNVYVGKRASLYCTSVGKALLAFLPSEEMSRILKHKRKKYTENTVIEREKLEEELRKVREKGFAVDNMEHEEGIRCVAAPIRNHENKVIASLSISGPSIRITEDKIPQMVSMVKETVYKISKDMGLVG
jgi:DNA-binding IclR family transcriptional regulator